MTSPHPDSGQPHLIPDSVRLLVQFLANMSPAARRVNRQQQKLKALLLRAHGEWVELPEILDLKISQFGARVLELRRMGYDIQNRQETRDGKKRSWYRLVPSVLAAVTTPTKVEHTSLFGDEPIAGRHLDNG